MPVTSNSGSSSPRIPRGRWVLAGVIIALATVPAILRYFVFWPQDQWQVDVEVYRAAGVSLLTGRPIYLAMTEAPQLLPFTYPPFAALLALPLAFVPFPVAAWMWTVGQVLATTGIVWYAATPLLRRTGPWLPLVLAGFTAVMLWLHPVSDGLRFGQVNAFLVLACLVDLRRPRPRWLRRVPPGVLVGLAMAIKLTPGVFVVHYLVCRRWKEAATAVGAAVVATLGTWLVLPEASFAFWGGALQDPARLGPNMGTSNQSIRGVLLRIGPAGLSGTLLWVALAGAVAVAGYALARRYFVDGTRAPEHATMTSVAEVGTVGLIACLVSPVAWVHHYHWIVPVIFALLGADPLRQRPRLWAAGLVTAWFLARMPWWGISWLNQPSWPQLPGRLLQNADMAGGLVALGLLWWVQRRYRPADADPGEPASAFSPAPRATQRR